ncbi:MULTISPECIES: histidine kinase [Kitasatospora]|uniref:histidine kinase n=1 Tax=Kitasatospora setae (strain ATCC 33774 / DSM 43861 / JCM 3304 / KCC A-0304 / NBRC 14216 / KM-6054) TaxID=452652 RepID=E4N5E7_KITSK|nr:MULTISPECIES: histidine kinase [Kitasatospora]BAJ26428.1 putative two-component system sensor kinase [Kitasatospora setae KM-6054]
MPDPAPRSAGPAAAPFAAAPFPALPGHPLLDRLARSGQRLRGWAARHPWLLDGAVVAVSFLAFCVPDLVHDGDGDGPRGRRIVFTHLPPAAVLAFQAALLLPLLWRRRRPAAAFAAVTAVFLAQWSLGAALRADAALLLALYALALHGRLRDLAWACAVTALGIGLVAVRLSAAVSVWDVLFFLAAAVTAAVALGIAVRVRRAQLAGLRERAARLEVERDQRSRLAAAGERARVAREMHDIVGHNLSVIITLADGGAYAARSAPERGQEALALIGDAGRQALGELRRMLGVLREHGDGPGLAPQPGVADLAELCGRIRAAGPEVVHRTEGDLAALDRGVQLVVYRIVQEALTNTLKHAGPRTRCRVSVSLAGPRLLVRIDDDGPPATGPAPVPAPGSPPDTPPDEGQGLTGMRERAALYGGTVSAGPAPGGGWSVRADLNVTPATPAPHPPAPHAPYAPAPYALDPAGGQP